MSEYTLRIRRYDAQSGDAAYWEDHTVELEPKQSVLDAILVEDPNARVACETLVTTGMAVVAGEITTSTYVHIPDIVRGTITSIGYTDANFGFDAQTCAVLTTIDRQSADIAMGVDKGGAGDQGMMFGYATDETPSLMPLPIMIAHRLAERLATVRKSGDFPWLRPDGKTQVSVTYEGSKPIGIDTIVVSAQHSDMIDNTQLRAGILAHVVRPVVHEAGFEVNDKRVVVGGPQGDAGLTGRKIIVDSYGGMARHGGGAFSGKDPSKVDRSATYAMRWVAKNIVAAGLAKRCEAQVAYAIGVAEPVSIMVDTFGTGTVPQDALEAAVREVFDLTPGGIIQALNLRNPIYRATAAYGHFGRAPERRKIGERDVELFTWEHVDRAEELKVAAERASRTARKANV